MSIRVLGADLQSNKKLPYALTRIYGIGIYRAFEVCKMAGIDPDIRVSQLTGQDALNLTKVISEKYVVQDELKREELSARRRLIQLRTRRGIRMRNGLPVRGQRTRSNAATAAKNKGKI
jgi:small subunit ribosomal protein S13